MKRISKNKKGIITNHSKELIHKYITALGSKNGIVRQDARLALVAMGEPAIDILAELATHPQLIIRWEAVKALSQIKDSITAPLLINALEDDYEAIRWIAAEGLIALGMPGLIALLQALTSYKLTIFLREGAHHVINQMMKHYNLPSLSKLLDQIENSSSYLNIPIYSKNVLDTLSQDNHKLKNQLLH